MTTWQGELKIFKGEIMEDEIVSITKQELDKLRYASLYLDALEEILREEGIKMHYIESKTVELMEQWEEQDDE